LISAVTYPVLSSVLIAVLYLYIRAYIVTTFRRAMDSTKPRIYWVSGSPSLRQRCWSVKLTPCLHQISGLRIFRLHDFTARCLSTGITSPSGRAYFPKFFELVGDNIFIQPVNKFLVSALQVHCNMLLEFVQVSIRTCT
jgi:hypothetical protein